jgi:hypothetical protein
MSEKQAAEYRKLCLSLTRNAGVDILGSKHGIAYLTVLSAFASATGDFRHWKTTGEVQLSSSWGRSSGSRAVNDSMYSPGPVVYFTQSSQLTTIIHRKIFSLAASRGNVRQIDPGITQNPEAVKRIADLFSSGELPFLVQNISSVPIGLDLSQAATVVWLQRSWSEAENQFAERTISDSATQICYVSKKTIDMYQYLGINRLDEIVRTNLTATWGALLSGSPIRNEKKVTDL